MGDELEQRILDVLEPRIVPLRFVKDGHLLRVVAGYMKEHEGQCERAKRLTDRP